MHDRFVAQRPMSTTDTRSNSQGLCPAPAYSSGCQKIQQEGSRGLDGLEHLRKAIFPFHRKAPPFAACHKPSTLALPALDQRLSKTRKNNLLVVIRAQGFAIGCSAFVMVEK